jgi:hypothetical protein
MPAAYIEHRPKSTDRNAATTHHAVVVDGKDVAEYKTQNEALPGNVTFKTGTFLTTSASTLAEKFRPPEY